MTEPEARPVANPDRTQVDGQHQADDDQDDQQGPPEDDDPSGEAR